MAIVQTRQLINVYPITGRTRREWVPDLWGHIRAR